MIARARSPYCGINRPFERPNCLIRASLSTFTLLISLARQNLCKAKGVSLDMIRIGVFGKSFAAASSSLVCLVQTGVSRDGTTSISLYPL